MSKIFFVFLLSFLFPYCKQESPLPTEKVTNGITCSEVDCSGMYSGPEFIDRSDVAHQFSNSMSHAVGDQLKLLYKAKKYSKVDFRNIEMSTQGMGSGNVRYKLIIPFIQVVDKCDAYTSFDHVGGWNHTPALKKRKRELQKLLLEKEKLDISLLKTTEEGLQEYWIQWKNKDTQNDCVNQ